MPKLLLPPNIRERRSNGRFVNRPYGSAGGYRIAAPPNIRNRRSNGRFVNRPYRTGGNIVLSQRRMSANVVQTGGASPSPTESKGEFRVLHPPSHPLSRELSQRESLEGTTRCIFRRFHRTKRLPPWGRWQPKADGEGFIVEYRKHIPSRRGDSRIARQMFADVLST